jgi:hypothetical protein
VQYLRRWVLQNDETYVYNMSVSEKTKMEVVRLNCFMLLESILPISSTSVAANQKTATALSFEIV